MWRSDSTWRFLPFLTIEDAIADHLIYVADIVDVSKDWSCIPTDNDGAIQIAVATALGKF